MKNINFACVALAICFVSKIAFAAPDVYFSNSEFIIDNFNEKSQENGDSVISANVFNRGYADAALVVYDKDGKIVGIQQIPGAGPDPSPISWAINNPVRLYTGLADEYSWLDARDSSNEMTKKTETVFVVPPGGRVEISKTSNIAMAFNLLNIAVALFDEVNILPAGTKISEKKFLSFSEKLLDSNLYSKVASGELEVADLLTVLSVFSETILDPDNLDGRKATQKVIKDIGKKASGLLTVAGWVGKGLNISGKLIDIKTYDVNRSFLATNTIDTAIPVSDPCVVNNCVCSPALGNIISGINQGQNSHFGSANIYAGWNTTPDGFTQNPDVTNPNNINNAPQNTGIQQSALVANSSDYSSTGWVVTSGSPSLHYGFGNSYGSITSPNGGAIAALNNANVVSTTMERTFFIPAGVKLVNVGMLANFVTNEYPAWVGSQYNDKATIEIKTGSGNVYQATLFNKELNSANFKTVTGLPSPLSSTGGQTGFEAINKTIPVANGGVLTITVKTTNVGDTAVPSATLVSGTKVK